jgi:Family of unknown function (DUF6326)
MSTKKLPQHRFEDATINVKVKLAALWTSFMFLYICIDYFQLFMPGTIKNILAGKAFVFNITQGFILAAVVLMSIPILMIFLSVALPVKASRLLNIIVAALHIPYMLFNLAGEVWMHMLFGTCVELVLLVLIIWYAWKWPRNIVVSAVD